MNQPPLFSIVRLLGLVMVCALGAFACKKKQGDDTRVVVPDTAEERKPKGEEVVVLSEITLTPKMWVAPDTVQDPEPQRYKEIIELALDEAGLFRLKAPKNPGALDLRRAGIHVEYKVDVQPPGKSNDGVIQAFVGIELKFVADSRRPDEPRVASFLLTETQLPRRSKTKLPELVRSHVSRTFADAMTMFLAKELIRRGNPDIIRAALRDEDEDVRDVAFQSIVYGQRKEFVDDLLELLKHDNEEVRDAAIGALVELREKRAVAALTEMSRFDDLDLMRRLVDAIGQIGGDEAQSWLVFVAEGHEHAVIKEMATQALRRLQKRRKSP